LGDFNKQINKVQGSNVSVIEVKSLLDETLCTLIERKEENFVGMKVKEILSEDEVSENMARKFNAETADFFDSHRLPLQVVFSNGTCGQF
jgi:hypothetical protein